MAAPLIAAAFGAAARFIAPRLGSLFFGSATRTAVTAVTADQVANDGRITRAAVENAGGFLAGRFLDAVGLRADPANPDAGLLERLTADPAKLAGLGGVVALTAAVLRGAMGTPMALVAGLALAMFFNQDIGRMANSVVDSLGFNRAAAPQPVAALADETAALPQTALLLDNRAPRMTLS